MTVLYDSNPNPTGKLGGLIGAGLQQLFKRK
jgi:hypothetical protein